MTETDNQLRPRTDRWPAFYNLETAAAYSFPEQVVTLDSIEDIIAAACTNGAAPARFKVLRLCAHEYTHWIDHVSTLWGRRLLIAFYRGLRARESDDLVGFQHIVRAHRWVRRSFSDRFFTFRGAKANYGPPWQWNLSLGCRFDRDGRPREDEPLMFVRFGVGDPTPDANLVMRMPVSAAALAECRAMASEYRWLVEEASTHGGATPADPETWLTETHADVYNKDLMVYMVGFHLVANATGNNQLRPLLLVANSLAWLALNAPAEVVQAAVVPDTWATTWRNGVTDRISPLLEAQDPGFIYALLSWNIDRGQPLPTSDGERREWLSQLLNATFGVSLDDYFAAASQERSDQKADATPLGDARLDAWLDAGDAWANALGPTGDALPLIECMNGQPGLRLPDALTGDFSPWSPCPSNALAIPTFNDVVQRYDYMADWTSRLDEFVDVCGL